MKQTMAELDRFVKNGCTIKLYYEDSYYYLRVYRNGKMYYRHNTSLLRAAQEIKKEIDVG